jgi:hypothetical protein
MEATEEVMPCSQSGSIPEHYDLEEGYAGQTDDEERQSIWNNMAAGDIGKFVS